MVIQPFVVNKISGSSSGWWQRPADWLPIDNLVSAGNDKIVGLYAIFPNDSLEAPGNTLKMLCNFAWTVNWGDGTTADIASGTEGVHTYDFDTIDADTETSEGYRQVVVTITATSGNMDNYVHLGRTSSALIAVNWLDIRMSSIYITSINLSSYNTTIRLNKFVMVGATCAGLDLYAFRYTPFKVISFDYSDFIKLHFFLIYGAAIDEIPDIVTNATTLGAILSGSYCRKMGNLTAQSATTTAYTFNGSSIEEIGAVDIRNGTSTVGILQYNSFLRKQGQFNIYSSDSISWGWTNCTSLISEINLITSNALADASYAFYSCTLVPSIVLSDASGITNSSAMLAGCSRLANLRMPGMPITFSIASCNMGAAALNTLFGDLADLTGLTAQAITITGNPGAATCDQTIATAKNWTVVS